MISKNTQKGLACVLGGFLVQFSLGTIYTFGNMSPYVASYLKFRTSNTWVNSGHLVWIFSMAVFSQGLIMALGGVIEKKIGTRLTCLIGGWVMSAGTILTYFSLKANLWAVIVTYGFIFGLGTGLTYSVAIAAPMKWFPNKKGLVAGAVVAGYGLGSLVFNFVQTRFINPDNRTPNATINDEKFFISDDVLDRIPLCFVVIGFTYAALQLVGVILMMDSRTREDPSEKVKKSIDEDNEEKSKGKGSSAGLLNEAKNGDANKETNLVEQTDDSEQKGNSTNYTNESAELDGIQLIQSDFTVRQAIRDHRLWITTSVFFFNGFFIVAVASLYKSFGQKFITNDKYMATVGAIAALFNSCGRLFWGRLMDHFSYRFVMSILNICMAVFMGTFYLNNLIQSEIGAKIMFFIWVCCLFFCLSGSFAILPAATAQAFGSRNMATIYGIIFAGYASSSILVGLVYSNLLPLVYYYGVFAIATVSAFISLTITQFHKVPANVPLCKEPEEQLE